MITQDLLAFISIRVRDLKLPQLIFAALSITGTIIAVDLEFSGYAVRYLRPNVTQAWKVTRRIQHIVLTTLFHYPISLPQPLALVST